MRWIELFAGGGGVSCGLQQAGHTVVSAIENDASIAECYTQNHPHVQMNVADVKDAKSNLAQIPGSIDALWASPVCKSHSLARNKTLAPRDDADIGLAILPYVETIQPELVIIENVKRYVKHPSLSTIIARLVKWRYTVSMRVLDAADYGVPQHRERLIVQARKGNVVWPEHVVRHRNWYEALEDLFDTMEPSTLAPWQQALWKPEYDAMLPVMIHGHYDFRDKGEEKALDVLPAYLPARTITASHNSTQKRIVLDDRIIRITPRGAARLQTFPDNYIFPEQVTRASEIIGNAVPPLMVQRITEYYSQQRSLWDVERAS